MMNITQPINMQIQNIKIQMNNIQSQFGNIENQIINLGIPFIGEQIENLGIQILNLGIQTLNIGNQLPKININNLNNMNIIQEIKNIEMQIQNIEMNISNRQISNQIIQMDNFGNNGFNMDCFNNNQNMIFEENNNGDNMKKISIIFKETNGRIKTLHFNYGTTINDIMESFLKEKGRSEYINTDFVKFIYNASVLEFGDKTKIEIYFRNCIPATPNIFVIDTYNHPL